MNLFSCRFGRGVRAFYGTVANDFFKKYSSVCLVAFYIQMCLEFLLMGNGVYWILVLSVNGYLARRKIKKNEACRVKYL